MNSFPERRLLLYIYPYFSICSRTLFAAFLPEHIWKASRGYAKSSKDSSSASRYNGFPERYFHIHWTCGSLRGGWLSHQGWKSLPRPSLPALCWISGAGLFRLLYWEWWARLSWILWCRIRDKGWWVLAHLSANRQNHFVCWDWTKDRFQYLIPCHVLRWDANHVDTFAGRVSSSLYCPKCSWMNRGLQLN